MQTFTRSVDCKVETELQCPWSVANGDNWGFSGASDVSAKPPDEACSMAPQHTAAEIKDQGKRVDLVSTSSWLKMRGTAQFSDLRGWTPALHENTHHHQ